MSYIIQLGRYSARLGKAYDIAQSQSRTDVRLALGIGQSAGRTRCQHELPVVGGYVTVVLEITYTIDMIEVEKILRALADATRLRLVNLLLAEDELCVCELTEALEIVQPKVSRHLAILREAGLVLDRREGLWIYYRIHPDLPAWGYELLQAVLKGCKGKPPYANDLKRLSQMNTRVNGACNS